MRCVSCLCCVWKDTCLQRRKAGKKCEHCTEEKMKEKVESSFLVLEVRVQFYVCALFATGLFCKWCMVYSSCFPIRVHKHVGQQETDGKEKRR